MGGDGSFRLNKTLTFHLTHSIRTRVYQNGNRITIVQNFHYRLLYTPVFQAHPQTLILPAQLFPGLLGLPTKEHVDLLFNPVFVIGLVCLGISSVTEEQKSNRQSYNGLLLSFS